MRIQILLMISAKECRHILRDGKTLLMLIVLPILQVLIIGFAISNELRDVPVAVLNLVADPDPVSLKQKIDAEGEFKVVDLDGPLSNLDHAFKVGALKAALLLPAGFHNRSVPDYKRQVMIVADGANPNEATLIIANLKAILKGYLSEKELESPEVDLQVQLLYNPSLMAAHDYVPGIIAVVLMLICVMMTANAIVRERELDSITFIKLGGITGIEFILGKVLPYLFFSLLSIGMITWLATHIMGLPNRGHLLWTGVLCLLFILTCLSLGMLVAGISKTQESALLFTLIGMVIPTFMLSGFMFPLSNMPIVLQAISYLVPSRYFYEGIQSVMVRGLNFQQVWPSIVILFSMAVVFFTGAVHLFKKDDL